LNEQLERTDMAEIYRKDEKKKKIKTKDATKRSESYFHKDVREVVRRIEKGKKPVKKVHPSSKNITMKKTDKEHWNSLAEYRKEQILKKSTFKKK
jgi:hypothetical protein